MSFFGLYEVMMVMEEVVHASQLRLDGKLFELLTPLENDGWKTTFLLGPGLFSGANC